MSLTLARLCGEWQLVSGANYSRYEQFVSRKPLKKVESRWRNQKAVEEEFLGFLRNWKAVEESGKPLKKSESHWRNWKAIEEDFLGFLGNRKAVEENRILCEENQSLREIKSQFSQDILEFLAISGSRFDTKFATMCVHGFTWLVFQFFNCS